MRLDSGTVRLDAAGKLKKVKFEDDWHYVRYKKETRAASRNDIFGDVFKFAHHEHIWIPDPEAQADVLALVAKWKAEGKTYLDNFDSWAFDDGTFLMDSIGHMETTLVTEEWPVTDCTFYRYEASDMFLKPLFGGRPTLTASGLVQGVVLPRRDG